MNADDTIMLAAAEGRASRRLRTIKRLEAELADIEALLPAGVSIEQLVATYNAVQTEFPRSDEGIELLEYLRSVKP